MCITMNKERIKLKNKNFLFMFLEEMHKYLFRKTFINKQKLKPFPQSTTTYRSYYFLN
jgi:hypothetical protein